MLQGVLFQVPYPKVVGAVVILARKLAFLLPFSDQCLFLGNRQKKENI
jgi:hypothetical protein